jgi:hypothetical protein
VTTGIGALIVGLGFLAEKFLNSKSASDSLNLSLDAGSSSYAKYTSFVNSASAALANFRSGERSSQFGIAGSAFDVINQKTFDVSGLDVTGGTGFKGTISPTSEQMTESLRNISEKMRSVDQQNLQLQGILQAGINEGKGVFAAGSERDSRNYNITVQAISPTAEVGKAVVQSIKAFEDRGGRTNAFFRKAVDA